MDYSIDVRKVERSSLRDISEVTIDTSLPCASRVKSYIEQIGNPYCYLDNGLVVGIGYVDTQVSLQDRLKSYACNLG